MTDLVATPLSCGPKGLGLFARRQFEPDTVIFTHEFSLLHLLNHSCCPNSQWVAEGSTESTELSGLAPGKVSSPGLVC